MSSSPLLDPLSRPEMIVLRGLFGHFFGCGRGSAERAAEYWYEIYAVSIDILRDVGVLADVAELDTTQGRSIS